MSDCFEHSQIFVLRKGLKEAILSAVRSGKAGRRCCSVSVHIYEDADANQ